jgi:hypothetical protein
LTRAELLEAASSKLIEAALFLVAAGEDRLSVHAEELAEGVDLKLVKFPWMSAGNTMTLVQLHAASVDGDDQPPPGVPQRPIC